MISANKKHLKSVDSDFELMLMDSFFTFIHELNQHLEKLTIKVTIRQYNELFKVY